MTIREEHQWYCFGTQPAPVTGYFAGDVLPCVCGDSGSLFSALGQVAPQTLPDPEDSHPIFLTAA